MLKIIFGVFTIFFILNSPHISTDSIKPTKLSSFSIKCQWSYEIKISGYFIPYRSIENKFINIFNCFKTKYHSKFLLEIWMSVGVRQQHSNCVYCDSFFFSDAKSLQFYFEFFHQRFGENCWKEVAFEFHVSKDYCGVLCWEKLRIMNKGQ